MLITAYSYTFSQSITPVLVATGGGSFSSGDYELSYSYGETSVLTLVSHDNILTQGYQQSYPDPSPDTGGININTIVVYPNPVRTNLGVYFYVDEINSFHLQIYSLSSRIIFETTYKDVLFGDSKQIDFSEFPKGLYLIHIRTSDGKLVKSFKVEKL